MYDKRNPEYWTKAVAKACKYSEYPTTLRKFLSRFDVRLERMGKRAYLDDDKEPREVLKVTIQAPSYRDREGAMRPGKETSFDFGMSIHDTQILYMPMFNDGTIRGYFGRYLTDQQWRAMRAKKPEIMPDALYSVLWSVGLDYNCPDAFDDFCAEYGYDEDSRKAFELYERCHKHARALQSVIPRRWIAAMPS